MFTCYLLTRMFTVCLLSIC